jgi:hypothetical protein
MTGIDGTETVSKQVRLATLTTWLMAPAGLLLVIAGGIESHWFGTTTAHRLTDLFHQINTQYGVDPPFLLRGRNGATELVVMGIAGVAFAALAPLVAKGRRWARTAGIVLGGMLFFVGLFFIAADVNNGSHDVSSYFDALRAQQLQARVPEVQSLLPPGWYSWFEDVAQGVQVLMSLAVVGVPTGATIAHGDYFVTKKAETAAPDEWDEAIARLHKRTVGNGGADAC